MRNSDDYVAWLRYVHEGERTRIVVCDSDAKGAFKVYRRFALDPPREPPAKEPHCWHRRIGSDGICSDCGKRAAIALDGAEQAAEGG